MKNQKELCMLAMNDDDPTKSIDIALFLETFETKQRIYQFDKRNYNTFTQIRENEYHGGIKIVSKIQYASSEINSISQEQLTVKFNFKDSYQTGLLITAIYLKPQLNNDEILTEFEHLRQIYSNYNNPTIIIGGDFNK